MSSYGPDKFFKTAEEEQEYKRSKAIPEATDAQHQVINPWLDGSSSDVSAIISVLKKMDLLRYEEVRNKIAKKAKIRVAVLDAMCGKSGKTKKDKMPNNGDEPSEDGPWLDCIDGKHLYETICATIRRYVILPENSVVATALWIFFSYSIDVFDINPRLFVTGPEKRCGKSTLLLLIAALSKKSLPASNASPAAIFRAIDYWKPTLVIDEVDSFVKHNDELRGILNSGHSPGHAYVLRVVGDDHEPKRFSTWTPMAVAGIGRIWDTLEDRSIIIEMQRKIATENVDRLKGGNIYKELKPFRQKLIRWAQDNKNSIVEEEADIPGCLDDRAADNWRPLLILAKRLGVESEAIKAAREISNRSSEDNSIRIQLLKDAQTLFERAERWHTTRFISALTEIESSPWGDWKNGKQITAQQIAKYLKPFGVKPKQIHIDGTNKNGYEFADFKDVFSRYLPNLDSRDSRKAIFNDKKAFNSEDLDPLDSRTGERKPDIRQPGDDDIDEFGNSVDY